MANKHKTIDKLLLTLSGNADVMTAKELAEVLKVSEKTIYRLVKEVNQNNAAEPLILSEKGKGFVLNHDVYLRDYRQNIRSNEILSPKERQNQILERLLLMSPKSYLIYDFCQDYFVSDAVIAKDRIDIQKRLKPYNLKVVSRQRALSIRGKEFDVRRAIADLVPSFSTIDLDQLEQLKLDHHLNYDLAVFVVNEIKKIEKELDAVIPYPYNINIFSHLYILIERIRKSERDQTLEVLKNKQTFSNSDQQALQISQKIIADIESYTGLTVMEDEIAHLFHYLISSRLQNEASSSPPYFSQRVLDVTHFYFAKMSETAKYAISENSSAFIDLANHISPMLKRLDHKIRVKNKMLGQIQMSYPYIFEQVESISQLVSESYGFPKISLDEVGFLTLYFARFAEEGSKPIKTLVMCSSGIGTSDLLRSKLERQFSELDILNVVAYRQINQLKEDYPDVELLISTIALDKNLKLPNVLVSALLIEDDKKRIREKIEEIRHAR